MASNDDNLTQQADEVEALASIYEDDWCVIDEAELVYGVVIRHDDLSLNLQVRFPHDYPSTSPPFYEVHAPWLRGEQRKRLSVHLDDIHLQHCGESVVYLWVERVREFLAAIVEASAITISPLASAIDQFEEAFGVEITFPLYIPPVEYECPRIQHSEPFTKRASTFQAHLATISAKQQVKLVMEKLLENKKIANATHNIMAYRICTDDSSSVMQSCDDDGETHAGSRLLHLLQIVGARSVVVVVSRWFGGILLGSERFKLINNCARELLSKCGYINDKVEKRGPKSRTK